MKLRLLATALLLGCTGIEDPLDFELEDQASTTELEFVIAPPQHEVAPPPPPTTPPEPPPAPQPTPARWTMWSVLEDVDAWLRDEVDLHACDVELPTFPTVSGDGSMLALALVSAPIADERMVTIRLLRTTDAKQVRAYTLLGPSESELEPDEVQRRVCHRVPALVRALTSGGHTTVPLVGGWDNPIHEGLPESVDGWPRVISDGATREVDATVSDIVIAPANADAPQLNLRAKKRNCTSMSGQFSKVWEAASLRIFTRGPCGC